MDKEILNFVNNTISGKRLANKEQIQMCKRFLKDLKNKEYEFKEEDPKKIIQIIENTLCHIKGENLKGESMRKKPFLLETWQKFIIYNLFGFYLKGTKIRRFTEAFIYVPRKNSKTSFISCLAWAVTLLQRKSGSTCYIIASALKQTLESFNFLRKNIGFLNETQNFRILDNNAEHSISKEFSDGSIRIEALAANPDRQDSLNSNFVIADELHAYKTPTQYNVMKESMKSYSNKLMVGITTAGNSSNSFCYRRLQYCKKILDEKEKDDRYFIFIAKADENENGNVDYLNPIEHQKANPNYNISVRAEDLMADAIQAKGDPQQRKDFLAKSLNIYTSGSKSYFDISTFISSDKQYHWTLDELTKMQITWYGGADLSKLHDLTAAAIVGEYKGILIVITHAFFPKLRAESKIDEDNIPVYQWLDDEQITLTSGETTNYVDVVNWFKTLRDKGFKINQIGYDRKFAEEFYLLMKKQRFNMIDEPQYAFNKSQGFKKIEKQALDKKLYFMHSKAYEYCVENVSAQLKVDDIIQYEKADTNGRIDLFDASVFATVRLLKNLEKRQKLTEWLGE